MTHILIAEPDSATGKALSLFIERKLSSIVTTEVRDVYALIYSLVDSTPDILLLSWDLYSTPAPELCHLLRKAYPTLKIILMSTNADHRSDASMIGVDFIHMGEHPESLMNILNAFETSKVIQAGKHKECCVTPLTGTLVYSERD